MASMSTDKKGNRRIQFKDANRKRQTLYAGGMSKELTTKLKFRVECLVAAQIAGHAVDPDTAKWVANLQPVLYDKLVGVGLLPPRADNEDAVLKVFLDSYLSKRVDLKASTKTVLGHTKRCLIEFFGERKRLNEITRGNADEWRLYLIGQNLAENTVRRRCGLAKQFFRAAVRRGLVDMNPFDDLVAAVKANAKRFYFVSRAEAEKVLSSCPDNQWRLVFALCRYGGLRCPSEHVALRWVDIDWVENRIRITSPKTAHHDGKDFRFIPLFPELRPYLEACRQEAEKGAEFVITLRRSSNSNLRTRLMKIIKRSGLKPWPKLFQNLRSTRETELAETYPIHVVCQWLGNSQLVAAKHYLQVTAEHYAQAAKATQNPTLLGGELECKEGQAKTAEETAVAITPREITTWHDNSASCTSMANAGEKRIVGAEGLEPPTFTV